MLVQQRKDRKSSSWSVLEAGCLCRLSLVLESWWSPGELRFAFHIGNLRRLDLHSCGNTVDELSGESEGKQAKKKKKRQASFCIPLRGLPIEDGDQMEIRFRVSLHTSDNLRKSPSQKPTA